jgi:hypothetical protein
MRGTMINLKIGQLVAGSNSTTINPTIENDPYAKCPGAQYRLPLSPSIGVLE